MPCGDTNKIMRKKFRKRTQIPSAGQKQGGGRDPAHPLQGCRRALHRVFKGGDRNENCHKTYALLCAILPSRFRREGHRLHNFRRHLQVVRRPSHRKQAGRRHLRAHVRERQDQRRPPPRPRLTPQGTKKRPSRGADFRVTRGWLQARFSLPRRACFRRGAVLRALAPTCGNTPRRAAAP